MRKVPTLLLGLVFLTASCIAVAKPAPSSAVATENTWTTRAPIPVADGRVESAVVNGKIYVIGKSTNYEYDPASDTWAEKTPMPTPRTSFAVAAYQGIIYVIAGHINGTSTGLNEAYNTSTDTWEAKKPLTAPRAQMDANMVDGKIYVIGGRTGEGMTAVGFNEVYCAVNDSWETKAPMPYRVVSYGSAVVDKKIYVIEGQYEYGSPMNPGYTQIYDTETDTWSKGTKVPNPIWVGPVACATTGVWAPKRIYVMGGTPGFGDSTDRNIVYDPETDSWSTGVSMPFPRTGFALAAVDDFLYAIGGNNGWTGVYTQNERYTPFGYGTVPLVVGVVSPEQNKTYAANNVSLTFTVSRPALGMVYSLDGQMKVAVTENITLTGLSNGLHNLTIYATDTFGKAAASETVTFTVAAAEELPQNETEPFPTTAVVAVAVGLVAVTSLGLLVYFKKRKR